MTFKTATCSWWLDGLVVKLGWRYTQDLALNAEVTLQAEVEAMARTFYWQFDQSIEDKCKHEAAIVQAVITAVEMAAIAVRTFWVIVTQVGP